MIGGRQRPRQAAHQRPLEPHGAVVYVRVSTGPPRRATLGEGEARCAAHITRLCIAQHAEVLHKTVRSPREVCPSRRFRFLTPPAMANPVTKQCAEVSAGIGPCRRRLPGPSISRGRRRVTGTHRGACCTRGRPSLRPKSFIAAIALRAPLVSTFSRDPSTAHRAGAPPTHGVKSRRRRAVPAMLKQLLLLLL